jgi:hypothetical protein
MQPKNSLIKAVIDEKIIQQKLIKGQLISLLQLLPLSIKSGSYAVNEAHIKKALAKSQLIFKSKVSGCHPRTGFCAESMPKSTLPPHSGTSSGGEVVKTLRRMPYSPNIATVNLFSFAECSRSRLTSHCPRTASRRARRGPFKSSPKTSFPMCFDNEWIAPKSMSASSVTKP